VSTANFYLTAIRKTLRSYRAYCDVCAYVRRNADTMFYDIALRYEHKIIDSRRRRAMCAEIRRQVATAAYMYDAVQCSGVFNGRTSS